MNTNPIYYPDITTLPKAHLHLHLYGACPIDLYRELSDDDPSWSHEDSIDRLASFDLHYHKIVSTIKSRISTEQLLEAIAVQSAAEHCLWVELSVNLEGVDNPDTFATTARSIFSNLGVGIGVISLMARSDTPAMIRRTLRHAIANQGNGIIGVGVAGPEHARGLVRLSHLFGGYEKKLLVVPHAGEVSDAKDVREALLLHPHRIAHGVKAVSDPDILDEIQRRSICLDLAISANRHTGATARGEAHPIKYLVDRGIQCTINADDPMLFNTDLQREYRLALDEGLSTSQLARCARASFRYSRAPKELINRSLTQIDHWEQATAREPEPVMAGM